MFSDIFSLDFETQYRLYGFIAAAGLFLILEWLVPARELGQNTLEAGNRMVGNIGLQIINAALALVLPLTLAGIALEALFARAGIFNSAFAAQLHLGLWAKIFICWLILDFVMYWLHRAYHRVGLLWRIHRLHHGDPRLDITTTFRTHPLEMLMTLVVRGIVIFALGMPLLGVITYEIIVATMALFIHSNIRLLPLLDKCLSILFITPNLHRIHHGQRTPGLQCELWFGTVNLGQGFWNAASRRYSERPLNRWPRQYQRRRIPILRQDAGPAVYISSKITIDDPSN